MPLLQEQQATSLVTRKYWARAMRATFGLDVIGLSEFVDLLDLPAKHDLTRAKETKKFRIHAPNSDEVMAFIESERVAIESFVTGGISSSCTSIAISDKDGFVGVGLLLPASGLDQPSRAVVCVQQEHPFSSTVADFIVSEHVRRCSHSSAGHLQMLDIPSHPITRRVAIGQGFQHQSGNPAVLTKIALGQPITDKSWDKARLSIERLAGLKLQRRCPTYATRDVQVDTPSGKKIKVELFELETLLSPTLFALPKRKAVVVPITRSFAADLLGTDEQYSFLDVPEAQFLSRRTYFNTIRAARAMIRGAAIAFYESSRGGGRGAIVATGRIVHVTSIPVSGVPEALQRGAVVDDPGALTSSDRVLATTFDNLVALRRPVGIKVLRQIGCVTGANFVSATPISAAHLKAIVDAGYSDD
jgi:hypothetical protein